MAINKGIGGIAAMAAIALLGGVSLIGHDPASQSRAVSAQLAVNPAPAEKQQPARTADNNASAITLRDHANRLARATRVGRKIKNRVGGELAHRKWRKRRSSGRA